MPHTLSKPQTVPIDLRARKAYPWMAGIVLAIPGVIIEDQASGIRVQVRDDGGLEEIGAPGHPHAGIASDPTAARAERAPVAGVR